MNRENKYITNLILIQTISMKGRLDPQRDYSGMGFQPSYQVKKRVMKLKRKSSRAIITSLKK